MKMAPRRLKINNLQSDLMQTPFSCKVERQRRMKSYQKLYFRLRGSREANFTLMEGNGGVLFLSLGLRRIRFGLVKGRVDYSRKRKKVVLKCGNVRCKRHVNAQHFSCITQCLLGPAASADRRIHQTLVQRIQVAS